MGVGVKRESACMTPKRTCDYPFCDIGESLKVIMKRPLITAMIMTASFEIRKVQILSSKRFANVKTASSLGDRVTFPNSGFPQTLSATGGWRINPAYLAHGGYRKR